MNSDIDFDKVKNLYPDRPETGSRTVPPSPFINPNYQKAFPKVRSYEYMNSYRSTNNTGNCLALIVVTMTVWVVLGAIITLIWNLVGPALFEGAKTIDVWVGMLLVLVLDFIAFIFGGKWRKR